MRVRKGERIIAEKVDVADSMHLRLLGLMFSKDIGERDGLLITPCNSIHTFFMRYDLDIVFLSKSDEVVKIIREMKPWRMTRMYFKAKKVLEMTGGTLPDDINVGDKLVIDV